MLALRIPNSTRVLAKDQEEFFQLAIKDGVLKGPLDPVYVPPIVDEVAEGMNMMWSLWEPTPDELQMLLEGGYVRLGIMGTNHPPVQINCQPRQEG